MDRCLRVLFWLGMVLLPTTFAWGQVSPKVTLGPLQKKRLHERFLNLTLGGDGYLYAFKGSLGHYWQFGLEGEYRLQVIRFNADLEPVDTLKIKRFGSEELPHNAFEVIPTPRGVALLSVVKDVETHIPSLQLFEPDFSTHPPRYTAQKLADLPGMSLGIDRPCIRLRYSPDSSTIMIAWRSVPQNVGSDLSLRCILLDRNLQVLQAPFMPFKQFQQDVLLREVLLLDGEHIVFTAQTMQAGSTLTGPGTIGYGILHYDVLAHELRVIRFSSSREVPVETRLGLSATGQVLAAGWYLDQRQDRREAGAFIGRITGADSLENLQKVPFDEAMRDALIRREKRSGAVGIRTGFHSALLSTVGGHAFVLHLRGDVDAGLVPQAPGNKANNTLHVWTFGTDFEFWEHRMTGFYNMGREEFQEAFSWRPLLVGGQWQALANDFSGVRHENKPREAQSYAWSVAGSDFQALPIARDKDFCILAPREMVQVGEQAWVGIAVAGQRWRLVRVESLETGSN